jgi:hypothetical protein
MSAESGFFILSLSSKCEILIYKGENQFLRTSIRDDVGELAVGCNGAGPMRKSDITKETWGVSSLTSFAQASHLETSLRADT